MMSEEIIKPALVHISENLKNIKKVVDSLVNEGILSVQEQEEIMHEVGTYGKNSKLAYLLMKCDPIKIRVTFIKILRATGNEDSANVLQGLPAYPQQDAGQLVVSSSQLNDTRALDQADKAEGYENAASSVPQVILSIADFEYEKIDNGAYGIVIRATHRRTGEKSAIKVTDQNTFQELKCLRKMTHPNIVKYYHSWTERRIEGHKILNKYRDWNCIQMELCEGGSLENWIADPIQNKILEHGKIICHQITCGVEYLHSRVPNPFIHRDLKPANILLLNEYDKSRDNLHVKIGDLGSCRSTYETQRGSRANVLTRRVGTDRYWAPEQDNGSNDYTIAVDVYSCGLIFYEILFATVDDDGVENMNDVAAGKFSPNFTRYFLREGALIRKMISWDSKNRPTIEDCKIELSKLWGM